MRRALGLVLLLLAGACIHDNLQRCGDRLCAPDAVCLADRDICTTQEALDVCTGMDDGALCTAGLLDGFCDRGVCVQSTCGDGVATGREQCDGTATLTCADFRFYYGTPTCTAACLYDTSGCSGSCGDGLVQSDAGEICDGGPPPYGCTDLSFDYGHNRCTARCTDSSPFDCRRFNLAAMPVPSLPHGGAEGPVGDAYRDGDLLVVAFGNGGLTVIDRGVITQFPGNYERIAARGSQIAAMQPMGSVDWLQNDQLVPLPDAGTTGFLVGIAIAPSGDLWELSSACEVRSYHAGAWQTLPSIASSSTCLDIAFDDSGEAYAIDSTLAYRWTGATWTPITVTGYLQHLNAGTGGHLIAVTDSRVYELAGDTTTDLGFTGTFMDAVAVGDQYVTLGPSARFGPGPEVLIDNLPMYRIRRMPDGSVLTWSLDLAALEPILENNLVGGSPVGVRAMGDTFLWWDAAQFHVLGSTATHPTNTAIYDAGIAADGTIYAAVALAFTWGKLGGTSWNTDGSVQPSAVAVMANGDVAIMVANGVIEERLAGQTTWAIVQAPPDGQVTAIAGASLNDLYAAVRVGLNVAAIEHFDGSAWTQAVQLQNPTLTNLTLRRGITLRDGTVVFTGDRAAFGSGTTWQTRLFAASDAGGTSKDDIWFASTDGLRHWNGTDLARVRWTAASAPAGIAATSDLLLVTSNAGVRSYVRLAVP